MVIYPAESIDRDQNQQESELHIIKQILPLFNIYAWNINTHKIGGVCIDWSSIYS